MLFNEFGNKDKPTILLMHGMLQDWHCMYDFMHYLAEDYRLIIPAMNGMYENSPQFQNFANECEEIEEYLIKNYKGHLLAVYGISQGATLMTELLARNKVNIDYAFLDGLYVAHQGKICSVLSYKMFKKAQKNSGQFPKTMNIAMKLMGLTEEDYIMMKYIYWGVDDTSMYNNLIENYTYKVNPSISNTNTKVYLWCGSKEPYAKKSNNILKQYLKFYKEEIWNGLGHGKMFYFKGKELCEKIKEILNKQKNQFEEPLS